ncbi:hypothetical protein [Exiguobacterium flavidum]|uniref:hypothetical protein n=1 Tax=Exiguobacterium flavidum TaxID=2184695 RepID=UPI000DF7B566|nr:hypothetical protein [Exiguobacterium flavidum]
MTEQQRALQPLKWVTGGLEAFLGIPVLGGLFIMGTGYTPLFVMLAFHIIVVVLTARAGKVSAGNIVGICASTIGFIPVVGMFLHISAAIVLLIDAARGQMQPVVRARTQARREDEHPF